MVMIELYSFEKASPLQAAAGVLWKESSVAWIIASYIEMQKTTPCALVKPPFCRLLEKTRVKRQVGVCIPQASTFLISVESVVHCKIECTPQYTFAFQ